MSLPEQVDVLVLGAGPAGLATACSLLAHGTDKEKIAIVDAKPAHDQAYSRALVVHAKTLEVLERIGCADKVIAAGKPCTSIRFNSLASGPLLQYDTSVLKGKTQYPFVCVIAQSETERVLYARLKEMGGEVVWRKKAVGVREDAEGWKVVLFEDGREVKARYVVGADAAHSVVRQAAGIPFPDPFDHTAHATSLPADIDHPSKADEVFCLADVRVSFPSSPSGKFSLPQEGVNAYISEHGPAMWIPFGDQYRLIGQVLSGEAPREPTIEYMQHMLETRCPAQGVKITELVWSNRFYVKFRLAEKYWEEHVPGTPVQAVGAKTGLMIVGDAAHVHSPMGGQGMNLGIRDSIYLGQAISHALSPTLSVSEARSLLSRWATDRHTAGKNVIALVGQVTFFAANAGGMIGWVRDWMMWLLGWVPGFKARAMWMLSGLGEKGGEY
ncbi:FAD/NADP-binding domain-containing protein [Dacryopinax primogenitus]|uniref:FAD/NADP-binding domain-containing protein n=1 Tax=Dacryopinax primogenitus (strain DJM 731) TaxID=1858805 RepID=M5GC65_DACPD|nr:FAD/NADP-binding domain-containing protein [Dacryopinax primogenitus]EJU06085.1 FAD/NADP-binding domain-containing protein [Dacryopinax primogenitus]